MSTITIFYAGRRCRPSLTSGAATPDACLRGALQGNGDPGMLATPLVLVEAGSSSSTGFWS